MNKLLLALVLCTIPAAAMAQRAPLGARYNYCAYGNPCQSYNLLNAVAANADAAARTITKNVDGYSKVAMIIKFTRSAGTAIVVTCTRAVSGTAPISAEQLYGSVMTRILSSGASTLNPLSDTYTVSATSTIDLEYEVFGYSNLSCVYAITGGGANDKITVQWAGIAGR